MEITYDNVKHVKSYDYMPFLSVKETKKEPNVHMNDIGYKYYTLIMYDRDAVHGTHLHWIVTNITVEGTEKKKEKGNVILQYVGPNPPDAKEHHYVFELYGSNEKVNDKTHIFHSRNMTLAQGKEKLGISRQTYPLIQYVFISKREQEQEEEREKKKGGTTKRKKRKGKRQRQKTQKNKNKNKNKKNK